MRQLTITFAVIALAAQAAQAGHLGFGSGGLGLGGHHGGFGRGGGKYDDVVDGLEWRSDHYYLFCSGVGRAIESRRTRMK